MTDMEELRKLAVATKLGGPGVWDDAKVLARIYQLNAWGTGLVTATEFIAAANPAAVLGLLDQLDAAEEKLGEIAAERDALAAKVERVRALHRAVGIYDECDCGDDADPATHLLVEEVGLTCSLMYRVCAECCRDDVYQTEGCASYHAHRLDEDYHCPTIRALDEEPQP